MQQKSFEKEELALAVLRHAVPDELDRLVHLQAFGFDLWKLVAESLRAGVHRVLAAHGGRPPAPTPGQFSYDPRAGYAALAGPVAGVIWLATGRSVRPDEQKKLTTFERDEKLERLPVERVVDVSMAEVLRPLMHDSGHHLDERVRVGRQDVPRLSRYCDQLRAAYKQQLRRDDEGRMYIPQRSSYPRILHPGSSKSLGRGAIGVLEGRENEYEPLIEKARPGLFSRLKKYRARCRSVEEIQRVLAEALAAE